MQAVIHFITEDYAKSWGTWEGIREIVQNWHDGLYETKLGFDVEIETENSLIRDAEMIFDSKVGSTYFMRI